MKQSSKDAARKFVKTWKGRGYEKGESQSFWYQLLHDVFGVETPADFIMFELPVQLKKIKFIDAYIPSTKVLIENKSAKENLRKAKKQSDKEELTPYEQAVRYSTGMKYSERPRWIVTCNFESFLVYDMEQPGCEPFEIKLYDLEKEYYLLRFLVEDTDIALRHEKEISIKAGELIGELYAKINKEYIAPQSAETLRSLNILCVRLVFCLFAEDSGLFGEKHDSFHDYMSAFKPSCMRSALTSLFKMLNTPYDQRDPYEDDTLLSFPYVNGGLFAEEDIEIPKFTEDIAKLLLDECSSGFDWSGISPTIFGALFEDTMNPETREEGCMHYTSVENIHKVIDPLFLDALNAELNKITQIKVDSRRKTSLLEFQNKLASLTFLDPACGSGNFLTETYLSLRRLENRALEILLEGNRSLGGDMTPIKVSISNFYGIEINDFAVTVAKSALWIAEAQMMRETEHIVARDIEFLPLKSYSHIEKANALTKEWNTIIEPSHLSYIIGNPPFKGKKSRDGKQRNDLMAAIGKDSPRPGNMDLVTGWFFKAARFIQGTNTKTAFVSTINITRGEQVSLLWKSMLEKYGIKILFAYKPFVWNSESKKVAQVHCTIIGFGTKPTESAILFGEDSLPQRATQISPYLREEETVLVSSRNVPICDIPQTGIGNKPIDGGFLLFKPNEAEAFMAKEPASKKYFMEWYGADELLKGKKRYFLWLAKCSPSELRKMPLCKERLEEVRRFRKESTDAGTRKLADFPIKFHVENIPTSDFIVIPEVTSENREYIPMEYVDVASTKHKLFSNLVKIMPNATFYHFGVLQSYIHMLWTKAVCGYKDFRPRYSTDIVFNNFPWPNPSAIQKSAIEETGKNIITARKKHPECSLADLYDKDTMPEDLRLAHINNDAAIRQAYGFPTSISEHEVISKLLEKYKQLNIKQ